METEDEIFVNRLIEGQLPQAITRDVLRKATEKDEHMMMLVEDIEAGQGCAREALVGYTKVFDELSVVEGLVMRGEHQLVIPEELRASVVQLAHEGHM